MYKYLGTPKNKVPRRDEQKRKREEGERRKKLICGTTNNKSLDLCEFCLYARHNAVSTDLFAFFYYYFIDKIHSTYLIREGLTSTFVYAKKKEDERMKKRIKAN